MEQTNIEWVTTTLAAIGTGFAGWLFGKRKNAADAQAQEIANTAEAVKLWRETATAYEDKFKEISDKFNELQTEIVQLRLEHAQLKTENSLLTRQVKHLTDEVETYRNAPGT